MSQRFRDITDPAELRALGLAGLLWFKGQYSNPPKPPETYDDDWESYDQAILEGACKRRSYCILLEE